MRHAVSTLESVLDEALGCHGGVRPLEQGEGDSFVAAFDRASDALGCAVSIQRSVPEPLRLRIGVHTGEVEVRDDAHYVGSTINRTARLRGLGHGGQTLVSGATAAVAGDDLPHGGDTA